MYMAHPVVLSLGIATGTEDTTDACNLSAGVKSCRWLQKLERFSLTLNQRTIRMGTDFDVWRKRKIWWKSTLSTLGGSARYGSVELNRVEVQSLLAGLTEARFRTLSALMYHCDRDGVGARFS
jgi:hypothetical protein